MDSYFIFWLVLAVLGMGVGLGLIAILYRIHSVLAEIEIILVHFRKDHLDWQAGERDRQLADQINQLLIFISATRGRFADAKKQEGGETLAKTLALDIALAYGFAYELTIQRPYGASMKLKEETLLRLAEMWLGHADVGHNYPTDVQTAPAKITWLRGQLLEAQGTWGRYFTSFGYRE